MKSYFYHNKKNPRIKSPFTLFGCEIFKIILNTTFLCHHRTKKLSFPFSCNWRIEESRLVTNQALKLFDKMSAFININASPIKPSFSTERCPDFVKEAKTFYACARFLNAVYFMEYFNTDLLIIDADMFINDDIAPYRKNSVNMT